MKFMSKKPYHLYLFLLSVLSFGITLGQDTYGDNFNSAAYNLNTGSQNWGTNWIETGETTNPSAGRMFINTFQLGFRVNWLTLRNMRTNRRITRSVDLSSYTSATLTFDYDPFDLNDETILVQLFNNNTSSYQTIATLVNTGTFFETITHNLTPDQISVNSSLRFRSGSGDWDGGFERVFIDNVLITTTISNPQISIGDAVVNENGTNASFTVTHSGSNTAGSFTVAYITANNSATAPGDYTATGSPAPTVTFSGTSGETQTITIPITNDNFAEAQETFFVNLGVISDGSVTITDGQGIGTINDDDNASIAINDIIVNEGDGTATLTITLTGANVSGGFSVPYTFANGSATDPADYTAAGSTSSPINFAGNINETQQITIPIINDSDIEGDHNFFVNLGTVSSALVSTSDNQGEVTIQDNDASITINDVSRPENAGTIDFTVTHNGVNTAGSFTVTYTTANNTATAPADYITTSSPPVLTFSGTSGETQTISVPLVFNVATEPTETFFLNLTGISNPAVIIADNQGVGTILDVDTSTDIDGDGIANANDVDNDNDGIPDCFEDGSENTTISDIFSINGDAIQIGPLEAQLTPNLNDQAGSATITDRVDFNDSFTFSFEAFLGTSNSGADGIAIIFHDDPAGAAAVGAPGEGLGASGIQNGIVLELDTYDNGAGSGRGDIGPDHGMIWDSENQTGVGLLTTAIGLGQLEDGNWHDIVITWDTTTNTISYTVDGTLAGTYTDDLINNFFGGNNLVFFGFTASTGGERNDQRIRFTDLCDIPLFVDDDGDGVPNYLDLDSDNDGIFDVIEGGDGAFDTNNDGVINSSDTGYSDTNNDGQDDDSVDLIENPDTNSDNNPDFIDNDSDGDGCFDAIEGAGSFTTADVNVDGELTGGIETNGLPSVVSPNGQGTTTMVTTVATTTINTQPITQSITAGSIANFSVAATGNGTLFYQWQQSINNGVTWTDIADGGSSPVFSGASTNALSLTNVPIGYNTYRYRVIINNQNSLCVDVISNEVVLNVRPGSIITNRRITHRVNN